jgi:hypothetical protein
MELLYFFLQARSPGLLCIPHYWIDLPYLNHELGHQVTETMAVAALANKQLVHADLFWLFRLGSICSSCGLTCKI